MNNDSRKKETKIDYEQRYNNYLILWTTITWYNSPNSFSNSMQMIQAFKKAFSNVKYSKKSIKKNGINLK